MPNYRLASSVRIGKWQPARFGGDLVRDVGSRIANQRLARPPICFHSGDRKRSTVRFRLQCLARRIADKDILIKQVAAWQRQLYKHRLAWLGPGVRCHGASHPVRKSKAAWAIPCRHQSKRLSGATMTAMRAGSRKSSQTN
jgi:hypothetical protein